VIGFVNDVLRRLIGVSLVGLGLLLELRQRLAIVGYRRAQARLRRRYGIDASTPVRGYDAEQRASVESAATRFPGARFAMTSGSTDEPKRILYPPRRIREAKLAFIDAFARDFARAPWRRHSFYLFSSLRQDDSLTSLMLAEGGPSYLGGLQAPYRLQAEPPLQELAGEYGDVALRLWVLALSNPGVLYSTNPSTLAAFLDALRRDWGAASALVRDFVADPSRFPAPVRRCARRLDSRGASARLRAIATSELPPTMSLIAPAAHSYVCWTGGYVAPFLRRLSEHLPAPRYRLLPMYSMSTETPETTPCYRGDGVAFIPLAAGVLYEFLPDGMADEPANLVPPQSLRPGRSYSMIVSDDYGLRRYQTDDLFSCAGRVSGLPDLRFLRRRTLSYSFTGEKLTAEQVSMAIDRLRAEFPALDRDAFLTCMPAVPAGEDQPFYHLIRIRREPGDGAAGLDAVAARCDAILEELNAEYRAKRESGRLGAMRGMTVNLEDFLERVGGPRRDSWEAQFKFLPLYARPWENDDASSGSESKSRPNSRT
jgi:hypothetical protein